MKFYICLIAIFSRPIYVGGGSDSTIDVSTTILALVIGSLYLYEDDNKIITPGGYEITFAHHQFKVWHPDQKETPYVHVWADPHVNINGKHVTDFTDPHHLFLPDGTHIIMHTYGTGPATWLNFIDVIWYPTADRDYDYTAIRGYVKDKDGIEFEYDDSLVKKVEEYRLVYPNYFMVKRNGKLLTGLLPVETEGKCEMTKPDGTVKWIPCPGDTFVRPDEAQLRMISGF
eukprot:28846_1